MIPTSVRNSSVGNPAITALSPIGLPIIAAQVLADRPGEHDGENAWIDRRGATGDDHHNERCQRNPCKDHADRTRQKRERLARPSARVPSLTRLPEKVTQFSAQHLAQRVARQSLHEDDGRRSLVIDQALGAVGPEPTLIEGGIVADDDRRDALTAAVVRQPKHGRLAHAGAVVEDALDNLRVDVEAAGDDQVVLAADQGQKAGVVQRAQVAGIEPAGADARRVASGLRQYSRNRFGPRSRTDPASPGDAAVPSSLATRSSIPGSGKPTDPWGQGPSSGRLVITCPSVMP